MKITDFKDEEQSLSGGIIIEVLKDPLNLRSLLHEYLRIPDSILNTDNEIIIFEKDFLESELTRNFTGIIVHYTTKDKLNNELTFLVCIKEMVGDLNDSILRFNKFFTSYLDTFAEVLKGKSYYPIGFLINPGKPVNYLDDNDDIVPYLVNIPNVKNSGNIKYKLLNLGSLPFDCGKIAGTDEIKLLFFAIYNLYENFTEFTLDDVVKMIDLIVKLFNYQNHNKDQTLKKYENFLKYTPYKLATAIMNRLECLSNLSK
jgi:hypothetical protein